ncbi:tyrosine-type recombinase/integrase [Klenkia brasiliensis]|uniref:Site-specific recombinase XerD n=1 Tax=Klenkia brasiliensis TaxID=333142 RepID=A0A1G7Z4U2_9ACTN|nr:tyrosine-type recombinase/integrase [Klenkia brasiliensis]SDH03657.1 Site-specific recombinase XerD [Klenkia brasiliensis]
MGTPKKRQRGEGAISEYRTKAGPRFLIKFYVDGPDGSSKAVLKRGFRTRREAGAALRSEINKVDRGEWVQPSKQTLTDYLSEWLDGQRLAPSTISSYRKNVRLHIDRHLGRTPLDRLTALSIDVWMRKLEATGRADGKGGLSARTVKYVFTILRSALGDAVKHGHLAVNPTDRCSPPTNSQARPPEMQAWTAGELSRFLRWAEGRDPDMALAWRLLAYTGMRRGEALALRWRDVDLDAGRLAVRRSVGVVKRKGEGEKLVEGTTKTGQSRVVDLDAGTVAALRAYRAARGALSADLVRSTALVLGSLDGDHRHPERFSRRFLGQVRRAQKAVGEEQVPTIRLHDLRHTHATLLLAAGEPVKVVSERLGHANATITLTVYQHVHPGMGKQAADRFASLLDESPEDEPGPL